VAPPVNSTLKLPQPDQVISGRYLLRGRLGAGGMGTVFLAEKLHLGTKVAIKFLDPDPTADPNRLKRFLQEARVAVEVAHPGAAQLLDAGHDEVTGALYLVFEHVEGRDVRELLDDEGRFRFPEARQVVVQVAEVLAFAHARGIVHRDVKPENIRMRRDLSGPRVKVLDFGIARLMNQGAVRLTGEGLLAGTPRYMAPEQIRDLPLDARTDVYALGLLLFEMLTGVPAFDGKNLSQVLLHQMNEPVPSLRSVDVALENDGVDRFLQRACAKQAIERFQNMEAFVDALSAISVAAWPSPRKELTPGPDAPTSPQRPQSTPTTDEVGQPVVAQGHERTRVNEALREVTLVVDEASVRGPRPDRPAQGSAEVDPQDPSKLPTNPARPAVLRAALTERPASTGTEAQPAYDPSIEATLRPPTPSTSRWWWWVLLAGLLAAALALALVKSGVLRQPPVIGDPGRDELQP